MMPGDAAVTLCLLEKEPHPEDESKTEGVRSPNGIALDCTAMHFLGSRKKGEEKIVLV